MKKKKLTTILLIVLVAILAIGHFQACKKIDLTRIAYVKTQPAENIFSTSIKATGDIIDLGEGDNVKEYGFCLSYIDKPPTLANKATPPFESTSETGLFVANISGLTANQPYQMRAYVIDGGNTTVYGNIVEFNTLAGGGYSTWLKYDDDTNADGIGLVDGGEFDVAIRFPTSALQQYNGYKVTKIKFFPRQGNTTDFYVTLWEGSSPTNPTYYEYVPNPVIGSWNEFLPSEIHIIDASKELWVGYWIVDQPVGEFPAGTDDGPATSGKSDMISLDGGDSWFSMSENNPTDYDFNWNIQVYITNEKGEQIQLVNDIPVDREKPVFKPIGNPLDDITSANRK